jgi:hypothetical protein
VKELLPLAAGTLIGLFLMNVRPIRRRAVLLPAVCVAAGGLASWVNGELESRWALAFVSVDAILVWVGAAAASLLVWSRRRVAPR